MKKNNIIIAFVLIVATSLVVGCNNMTVSNGDGSEKVVASGQLNSEKRALTAFNKINLEGVFNVYLTQGDKESVKVEADENVLPLIITSVANNALTVKMKDNTSITKMNKINVYITFVDIAGLSTEGVGLLNSVNALHFNDLELDLKGVGATRLEMDAAKLTIHSEIVGALFLSGKVTDVTIKHKGIGAIQAFDLKAELMELESDGVGQAEVFASKELIVDAKGLGGVQYKGNPSVKNIKSEGLGKVEAVQ